MSYTIAQIAEALGTRACGATDLAVTHAAEPADADAGALALAMKPEYAEDLAKGAARAALLWEGADWQALGLDAAVLAPRPRYAMSGLTRMMDTGQDRTTGIHPSAVIDETARLGEGVSVGPLAVIGSGAVIGAGTVIGPQCFVGAQARIGAGGLLREGVRIAARAVIGARVIAQPGAVVGGDGFSFVTPEESAVERVRDTLGDRGETRGQPYARIHSLGSVRIGDDVELGANCCIDRGTIRDTVIGDGTKLDNLVQIGHNVNVGRDSLLCALTGIAGSTRIGDNVVLAGQTGVGDNLFIGDNVITGGGTKVLANVPAGRVVLGYPAMKMDSHIATYKGLRRLPRLFADVAALKKAVFKQDASD
ncbi:UDP-3-O-(3-hydroxymyristoyl)glucosamine N-acyltransferase [Roseovarius salinarum]|uniref:UDP-3-O-(3-hydroxymyristoyl)glucosamine N-acyltransferase n=1 Tax=Roseovarius salinarum TaxID=1981892 RepID=UPI000C34353E|nr:UDP-3-O-(3-hydroxymyristoyl)glucosamine N-acyltransferase [Roseovarius salinarum]